MSPTSSVDGTQSPDFSRRMKTPSGSDSSPTKSPSFRRNLSSNGDDREDKKFKRRSGNFLLDSRRPTSPLAKQNPLTQSWSPGSPLSSSPPSLGVNRSPNRMSQSWCVDMEVSSDTENHSSKLPKSRSIQGESNECKDKVKMRKKVGKDSSVSDSVSAVSKEPVCKMDFSDHDVTQTNGVKDDERSPRVVPEGEAQGRVRRQTVTLSDDDVVFKSEDISSSTPESSKPVHEQTSTMDSETSPRNEKPAKETVTLQKGAIICPPSKLPTFNPDRKLRNHRESAV